MKLQSAAGPPVPVVLVAISIWPLGHLGNHRVLKQAKARRKTARHDGAFKNPRLGTKAKARHCR